MATFKLDTSKLAGGQFGTIPFRQIGEFRDLQLRCYQNIVSQDMEAHYLEIHFAISGVDESLPS